MVAWTHFLERLLGLDRGFLSAEGELHLRFDPHWPGPLIGSAGSGLNWLLGAIVLGLLVLLAVRRRSPSKLLLTLMIGGALLWPVALLVTHLNLWTIALAVLICASTAALISSSRREGLLLLTRAALVGLLLSLLSGSVAWNMTLAVLAAAAIFYIYRREGRSSGARIALGVLRAALMGFVLLILNNPVLTRVQLLVEPSVVAVLIDDSLSMKVRDLSPTPGASGPTRLEGTVNLLCGDDRKLMRELAKVHTLRFFQFDQSATSLGVMPGRGDEEARKEAPAAETSLVEALGKLQPVGSTTQVVRSLLGVLDLLQGQRLAGVVLLTDGRDTPAPPPQELFKTLKTYGVRVYPIAVGSNQRPRNIELQSVAVEDSAFKDDIVNVKLTVRGTGYEPNHPVHLRLMDRRTGLPLRGPDGRVAAKTITVSSDQPVEEEMLFKPDRVGQLEIKAVADPQAGEIDEDDNVRTAQLSVLDARIAVLYVEGYPRWEYRYIKNEMIRDKTVDISCLLTSADQGFAQEGDPPHEGFPGPITRFPESIEELMPYDVILFGDVEPRQFTDRQLQMVSDFVAHHGGGFGMIAGPQSSPAAYRNTPIEALLPVNISHVTADEPDGVFDQGFRPILTKEGADSSIFRFLSDKDQNTKYLKQDLQPLFWFCRGVTPKPGVGIVYAEHPTDVGPDGHQAPLLVMSHFGAGRTLFSAIDDSWRWRFYTGENVFDTYWVQQLRWLARGKKLGQRRLTFATDRQVYDLGQQVRLRLGVLDPVLLEQLPPEINVQVMDDNDRPLRIERLQRQPSSADFVGSFVGDRIGRFVVKLPPVAGDVSDLNAHMEIIEPRLELTDPRTNVVSLSSLAAETFGQVIAFEKARAILPGLIPSAARTTLIPLDMPLWNAPLAMVIFMLLITAEWVLRKAFGML